MTAAEARTILVAGTASHVGKSTVAAGLCRLLADRGVDVAPFKAQNMSNNARAVPKSVGGDGRSDGGGRDGGDGSDLDGVGVRFGEVGVSQYVQARAARVSPETDHNPVLLKPRGEGESQLVVDGEAVAHYAAGDYYEDHWHDARDAAEAAYGRLAADHDVVVAEGAGSIAEINLQHRDLANVETARFADADVLLVADIERGGVFASLVGTLELLPDDLRDRVVGAVITKFRGDVELLAPGLATFEERTGVPVLGVLPYEDPGLPEEDSVALPPTGDRAIHGADDGVPDERTVTIAVLRLPRVSNATDVEPLATVPGVRVAWVPVDRGAGADPVNGADAVVVPGTKNTVDDLLACRDGGFLDALRGFEGPVAGLCGGYQILGERIVNAAVESTRETVGEGTAPGSDVVAGAGLLPVETVFSEEKRVVATELRIDDGGHEGDGDGDDHGAGPLTGVGRLSAVAGYEIHMGDSRLVDGTTADRVRLPFSGTGRSGPALGVAVGGRDGVVGTYLHGLFENAAVREAFLDNVYDAAGKRRPDVAEEQISPFDRAADLLREHVDLAPLGLPIEE